MNKEPINQFNYELVNIDMRDLYIDIICNGVECPEVIVVKELEDGSIIQRRIMENGNISIIRLGLRIMSKLNRKWIWINT